MQHLFDIGLAIGSFILFKVIVNIIIGHWIAEKILAWFKRWVAQTERGTAIWIHYLDRAEGKGHNSNSVMDCYEGKCMLFKTAGPTPGARAVPYTT